MIVADDPAEAILASRIVVADLTLQGGACGIHLDAVGTSAGTTEKPGRFAQYNKCVISHVTLRDMSVAGIFLDQFYGFDNNFFDHVNFVHCDAGLKQRCDPLYKTGETSTMMYMDKVVFYKCQFLKNRVALDLTGKRACNLNAWISCLFQDNHGDGVAGGAASMRSYVSTVFANCDFVDNGGSKGMVSNNHSTNFVRCRFSKSEASKTAMVSGPLSAEGTAFFQGSSNAGTIVHDPAHKVFLYNCIATNVPLTDAREGVQNGVFFNNLLFPADKLNGLGICVFDSVRQELAPAPLQTPPIPQLLFGSDWRLDPVLAPLTSF
jgi:hypothetical protein